MFFNVLSDQELVRKMKLDNHQAFKEIFMRYWDVLLDSAYKRIGSKEESEEIVQELFVSLYQKREILDIHTSVEAYLKVALKSRVFNYYRSKHIHGKYMESILAQKQIFSSETPYQNLHQKELSIQMERSIGRMPAKCREVFLLSKIESLSHRNISEKLQISISTVEKHIRKAMDILRTDFTDYQFSIVFLGLIYQFS
ncbi:RNA polymerase sigma-70 factor [Sphingobacterium sp. SYP-B4668]|uniref:RNA polymerase sigma-70 factor n=1 Tax=Sphingobacterium sp. SYP-B4668 TaxID=2996035 RepID=UPI0022DD76A2|nr:RNA polymerase sigma-70 factor [Sphingobacterium sp. SYP-B4668]